MLDLRRLRLLRELHARGTIAAVADALQFTPSAVSQQLAVLEREAGQPLFERAGRGVRLTDAALVLVGHAEALLDRAELAEAELAAAAGAPAGRGRIAAFQSAAHHLAVPAIAALAAARPACAASSSRPSRRRRCRPGASATSTWCSPTSGTASRSPGRRRHRPPRPAPGSGPRDAARRPPAAAEGGPVRIADAARRALGHRPRGHGLERAVHAHLPRASGSSSPTSATAPTTAACA